MRSSLLFVALFSLTGGVAVAAQDTAGTGLVQAKAPEGARAFIVSPKDGDAVGQEVHVVFGIEGMSVAATTKSAANSGHHHLLIDQSELPMQEQPIPSDEFHNTMAPARPKTRFIWSRVRIPCNWTSPTDAMCSSIRLSCPRSSRSM